MRKWVIGIVLVGFGLFYASQAGGCDMIQEHLKGLFPPQQQNGDDEF